MKFSEAVKSKNNTVILKQKNTENKIDIENKVKSKVTVTELQIGIKNVKTKKTSTVVIECDNKNS